MEEAGSPAEGSPVGDGAVAPGSSDGSAQVSDWGTLKTSLGELGTDKSLESYKDLNGLVKSHIEAQKMIGNSIRLPGKDLEPEARTEANNAITAKLRESGVIESIPDAPEGYEFSIPETEGFTANEKLITGFKDAAHKAGVPQAAATQLFDWYLNHQESVQAQSQIEFENMKDSMKKEFGGLYPRKMEAARRAVAKYMGVDGDGMISNLPPAIGRKLVMAFAEIGDPMLEDGLVLGETIPGVKSKEEVTAKMESMMQDEGSPLMDLSHPGHNKALEEYTKLNRMLSMM
jgi:hypothetical protein